MSVVRGEARVYREARVELVESPFWSDGVLYWNDIPAGVLHVSPGDAPVDGSGDREISFPGPLASIHPRAGRDGFVAALADRVVLLDADGAVERELGRVEHPGERMRLNEGKVDPQGRFVVGSLDEGGDAIASWYRTGDDGLTRLVGGVTTTNGLEWSADGRTVYMTDTAQGIIFEAPWDAATGPGEQRPFHRGGRPDGLALDTEGCFWSADYGSGTVVRIGPDGAELERVHLPCPEVAGVCFGGDDRSTLFVGGARAGMSDADLARFPLAGCVFAVDTAVQGLPVRAFAG